MKAHGSLTEGSLSHSLRAHTRKGREGKGVGREGDSLVHPSIDLTVGADQEAWMNEELDLLDDDARHIRCKRCDPRPTLAILDTFTALCGRRAVKRTEGQFNPFDAPPNTCLECKRWSVDRGMCPKCDS